ncbi:MAG: U32 family peptidase [Endomicrobium sp.]|jgi:putative protease|nr:U32 family peptidase [Endomicrobium sp.]
MKKLEILAPAGSKEAFIAAVRAGADAVYCGLENFNARGKAQNFTPQEFFNYTAFARENKVKVYAALNVLIKQTEIQEAVKTLNFIAEAKADAVIVQDFGIAQIARKYFPQLKLHASTQMNVHNSYAVLQAQEAGIERVVLARELSLEEIRQISQKTSAGLEIFCHGALCFSVSGICLMSSFIGGCSANRGACAQPCRRRWSFSGKEGFYLSPKDLRLAQYINEIKNAGVSCIKIEGRMKNAQYVYKTARAYRIAADAPQGDESALKEAQNILDEDFARKKTSFNFIKKSEEIFEPDLTKQTGVYVGKTLSCHDGVLKIKTSVQINKNDIIKASNAKEDRYITSHVKDVNFNEGICEIKTDFPPLKPQTEIFKTYDGIFEETLKKIIAGANIEKNKIKTQEINVKYPVFEKTAAKEELFLKIDDLQWLKFIKNVDLAIIYALDKENTNKPLARQKIDFFELPSYIEEADLPLYERAIKDLLKNAENKFILNNIGHFRFFKDAKAKLYAGPFLYALNSFAADFLIKNKIINFTFSHEDDIKNISEIAKTGLSSKSVFYLCGFPPLAVSKMTPHKDLQNGALLKSQKDSFNAVIKGKTAHIIAQHPVMLFNKMPKLKNLGIRKYIIDLSFIKPSPNYLNLMLDAWRGKQLISNEYEFNFERKLK